MLYFVSEFVCTGRKDLRHQNMSFIRIQSRNLKNNNIHSDPEPEPEKKNHIHSNPELEP